MKSKKFLSLILVAVMSLSSVMACAEEGGQADVVSDDVTEETVIPSEESDDDPTEEIAAMPEGDDDGSVDYSDMFNWAYWNEGEEKEADLFFVCPTVDMGDAGNYVADISSEGYRKYFVGATLQELGIYSDVASVYAPYYRQATFPVYSMHEEERETYLDFAYQDVKDAFLYYFENSNPSRPLILAGFSQGADQIIRIMKDLFDDPKYQRRLVAAYCIGWKLTEEEVNEFPHLVPAEGESDTGVIIAFNSESEDITSSIIIGENEKTYAINPLNWKTTGEKADKSLNKGACFTDYSGNIKEEIPSLTGAYIDEKRGALKVTDVTPSQYPGKIFEDGIYHLYDYQFFFRNLQENVKTRLSAFNDKYADRIDVYYNDDILGFDVEPIIENGRTLVPFRAIFEAMGCVVNYAESDGKQIVSARRGKDSLMLTIGENKMYFNNKEIPLEVPAKIVDSRTLVPLRAVSEVFSCDVLWDGDTRTIYIYSPVSFVSVRSEKLTETITDDNGNVLVEAIAYYPILNNSKGNSYIDNVNWLCKWNAEKFIDEAKEKKEDALIMKTEMGETFIPYIYEMTYEENYNYMGYVSFTYHKYINLSGAHPTAIMESESYNIGLMEDLPLIGVLNEAYIRDTYNYSLMNYVVDLFVNKLKELDPDSADTYTIDYVRENIGSVQFYITRDSVVLYCNQGEMAHHALGLITIEIPYDPDLFLIDMHLNNLDEYVFELEYDSGYEWIVVASSQEKIEFSESTEEYAPENRLSENYPAGMTKISVKGKEKGNAGIVLAHVEKDGGVQTSTKITIASFYVDEDNKITLVSEDDGMFLLD